MPLLGIDIGGTGIKGALVDADAGVFTAERFRIPTPKPATPEAIACEVRKMVSHYKYKGVIGATFPAIVKGGIIYSATNVDASWIHVDAEKYFSEKLRTPVAVVNDADAAGMAEMRFGAGMRQKGVVILMTLGTGIGTAIFVDGKLLPNTEFGQLKIRGRKAEDRASYHIRESKNLTWEKWAKRLNEFIERLEELFSPDLIIIGGGASRKADKFFPLLKTKTEVRLVPAQLQNDAGIIGAALYANKKLR